jgi:hypothetical protein
LVAARSESVTRGAAWPRFIYITGCDGTGKTTQARLLLEQLRSQGIKARHVWLRFPFLLSLPLLAYARWRGLSWYQQMGGKRQGYWGFRRSRLLQLFLPWTLLADAALAGLFKIYLPQWRGETVVCERFVLDILVDLAVAFDDPNLHRHLPGRLFLSLLPGRARIAVLDLDAAAIRLRRPDLIYDKKLETRLAIFRLVSGDWELPVFTSGDPADEVCMQLYRKFYEK